MLRLGLGKDWELRVKTTGAYIWDRVKDPASRVTKSNGADPVSLGVKITSRTYGHFAALARRDPAGLRAVWNRPPFKTSHTTADLRLAADWDIAPAWSLNPNVGVAVYQSGGRTFQAWLFAMTLNCNPSPIVNFFVDTGVQSPEMKGGGTWVIYHAGVAYIIGHDIQVDAASVPARGVRRRHIPSSRLGSASGSEFLDFFIILKPSVIRNVFPWVRIVVPRTPVKYPSYGDIRSHDTDQKSCRTKCVSTKVPSPKNVKVYVSGLKTNI